MKGFVALALILAAPDSGWRRTVGIDLLPLLDPEKDRIRGGFKVEGGVLDLSRDTLMQIPYVPPEEYDLTVRLERKENEGKIVLGLASGEHQFDVVLDNFLNGEHRAGLHVVDGRHVTRRPDAHIGKVFSNDHPAVVQCRVRRTGVDVSVDGKTIASWKGSLQRLSVNAGNRISDRRLLFLNTALSRWNISRLELLPVDGRGRKARE